MNKLYSSKTISQNESTTNDNTNSTCELIQSEYEKKFLKIIIEKIINVLRIDYNNRKIVSDLLFSCLEEEVCKKDGLLEQYLNSQIDKIADDLRNVFGISKEIKVNYEYASHAKFRNLFNYINDDIIKKIQMQPKNENNEKWFWKMEYCKKNMIPPAEEWAWSIAEKAYNDIK